MTEVVGNPSFGTSDGRSGGGMDTNQHREMRKQLEQQGRIVPAGQPLDPWKLQPRDRD